MNYLLLRRFLSEGILPTFQALLDRGSLNRLLPTIPAWTPTNWSSLVTGAPAGTTQLGGWTVRHKTDPWDAPLTMSWDYRALGGAETFWEVADQSGLKTLVVHYPPASWGAPLQHGYVVAPGLHDAPLSYAGPMTYTITRREVRTLVQTPGETADARTTDVEEEGLPPGSGVVQMKPARATGWKNVEGDDLGCALPVVGSGGRFTDYVHLRIQPDAAGAFAKLAICSEPDGAKELAEVPWEGWSNFVQLEVGPERAASATRFRMLSMDGATGTLRLVRTVVYGTQGVAQPASLDPEILQACGHFYDRASVNPAADVAHLQIWLDDLRYMGEWQVKVASYIQQHYGWDHLYTHWHPFDFINHATANGLDPDGPDYDRDRADFLMEAQRQTYLLADDILAQFLALARDDDLICVTSDHGITSTHRVASVPDRLVERGLIVQGHDGRIDRARSKAYVIAARGCEVFVNLQGREPGGIVPRDQYDEVQEQIIDALIDWRDPLSDKRPVALALKLQDAQIIGYWGDVSGDVVFCMNRGYGWGQVYEVEGLGEGASIGPSRGAIHGSQIPTSETSLLSNMACFLLAGPGVRQGYERDYQRWGMMRMIDLAPTFAQLLGLNAPRHSMGAVLNDLLDI
jgi:predicted AlkP superfamily phosphohydrolase/phosphomutase